MQIIGWYRRLLLFSNLPAWEVQGLSQCAALLMIVRVAEIRIFGGRGTTGQERRPPHTLTGDNFHLPSLLPESRMPSYTKEVVEDQIRHPRNKYFIAFHKLVNIYIIG